MIAASRAIIAASGRDDPDGCVEPGAGKQNEVTLLAPRLLEAAAIIASILVACAIDAW